MPKITYVGHQGREHTIEVAAGTSVMQGATANGIPGIDADCGGQCACATCQVFVASDWLDRVGKPGPQEALMLEATINAQPNSRLSCQIVVIEGLDGLVVHLPERQH
jgi:ferredoxin, 2Fe-2S